MLLLGSCSKGGDEPTPTPPEPTTPETSAVTFRASLNAASRAGDNYFDEGDAVGIFGIAAQEGQPSLLGSNNRFDNVRHYYQGGKFVCETEYGILKNFDEKLAYVGVYPYQEGLSNNFSFTAASDQRTGSNYTNSDLCTAAAPATDATEVSLTFYHRMSQVIVNVSGDNLAGDLDVRLNNVILGADVDLNQMQFTANGNGQDVVPAVNGLNSWKAIVAPQVFPAHSVLATVTFNGREVPLMPEADLNLASGKSYEFNVTIINDEVVDFRGDILPWNSGSIENVVPQEVRDQWGDYMPIYDGITPPNIEGCVFVDPFETVYTSDGGYQPGYVISPYFMHFYDQNSQANTINFEDVSNSGNSYDRGPGAFISGSGNNFTVFFNTEGSSNGIYTKQALVLSGTKTAEGIANFHYAFVMVDKGSDPNGTLMPVNAYRIFRDNDGLSVWTEWPGINFRGVNQRPANAFATNGSGK